jgi:isopentenyldiphosphate isomerase
MKGETKIREFVYAVEVKNGVEVTLAPDEHDDLRWCDTEMLFKTLEKEDNVKAANKILAHLNA